MTERASLTETRGGGSEDERPQSLNLLGISLDYDPQGKVFSITHKDGTTLSKGLDGNWFKTKPGEDSVYQPCRVIQDNRTGAVTVKYADRATTFSTDGIREQRFEVPKRPESAELKQAREHLLALAPELKADMEAFERRAQAQKLPEKEIQLTYGYVGRMLDATSTLKTTPAQRELLAQQVIKQAAEPQNISQGNHSTCNVTTIESVVYTRCPSRAAKLVSDVALTGQSMFLGPDNQFHTVKIDQLAPTDEAKTTPVADGKRSYASQLFQVSAVNMHWTMAGDYFGTAGQFKYEQLDINSDTDTGERLWDVSQNPPKEMAQAPSLTGDNIVDICNAITGKKDCIYLAYDDGSENKAKVSLFKTEEELKAAIQKARGEGKLPAIIIVSTDQNPFWNDMDGGAYDSDGNPWHVVTVRDFDANGHRVAIANQWSQNDNHLSRNAVGLRDLYMASRSLDYVDSNDPEIGTLPELESQVKYLQDRNRREIHLELELLRVKHNLEKVDDATYQDQLLALAKDTATKWSGTVGEWEQRRKDRVLRQFSLMLAEEDPAFTTKVQAELSK